MLHRSHQVLLLLSLALVSISGASGCSEPPGMDMDSVDRTQSRVIYDTNDRVEVGNLPYWHKWFDESRATGALVARDQLTCNSTECDVEWYAHTTGVVGTRTLPLCSDEPYVGQPVAASCTAFLIGTDLMATAGHCARRSGWCDKTAVVFDFTVNRNTGQANTTFDRDREVYYCSELVALGYEGSRIQDNDFAVFRLDRATRGRMPLPLRQSGDIARYTALDTLSTPLGLPLKLEQGAFVTQTSVELPRFEANIDSAPGSSGGAVFNRETGEVEGILVDGTSRIYDADAEADGTTCARSHQCSTIENGSWAGCKATEHPWVLVSRIERVVEVLEDRSCFDGKQNGQESDVDCGGPACEPCFPGGHCTQASDCQPWDYPPACHHPVCEAGICGVDTSTCECHEDSECDDGDVCTRDSCGRNQCRHNPVTPCN